MKVESTNLQLFHQPVNLHAKGLFAIDNQLYLTVIIITKAFPILSLFNEFHKIFQLTNAMVMYLVIFIQFYQGNESNRNFEH